MTNECSKRVVVWCAAGSIGAGLLLALWFFMGKPNPVLLPLERVVIAMPNQSSTGSLFVAIGKGMFKKHGLDVVSQPHELGLQALRAVLGNTADLAIVADTPFMFKVLSGEKISIIATTFNSRRAAAIVARKDRGISTIHDLAGKTIGVSMGTNMQFFLDTMLLVNKVPNDAVRIVDLPPQEMLSALQSGKVDALTAWHPHLAMLQRSMGGQVISLYGEDVLSFRFNLVGRQDYIARHPGIVRKTLAALEETNKFMRDHPAEARAIISRYIQMDMATLEQVVDVEDFNLKLDQSLLLALDDQSRWAIKNGLTKAPAVLNFLDYIYFDALTAVRRDAVTMIH